MQRKSHIIFLFINIMVLGLTSCSSKKHKSDIDITFTTDTLNVGYTYWWPESGPFIGECGEEYALVFLGTINNIDEPTDTAGPLYSSQEGIIQIENVFKIKDLGKNKYTNQNYFKSDCFNSLDLTIGDKVLVVCYDYEDNFSIPGNKSILKVSGLDDPIVKSIKKYIDKDLNPIKIRKDVDYWKKYDLDGGLNRILKCKQASLHSTD